MHGIGAADVHYSDGEAGEQRGGSQHCNNMQVRREPDSIPTTVMHSRYSNTNNKKNQKRAINIGTE